VAPDRDDTVITPRIAPRSGEAGGADLDDTVLREPVLGVPDDVPVVDDVAPVAAHVRIGANRFPLDAALYVGRRPSAPRIADPVPPRLVTVPSPRGEVSRTHARIRQVGASVVVTDLRSANGTRVIVPQGAARTLRQGESMVVPIGSAIDLGDGILLAVEPTQGGPA
jgi:hypothetical protein